MRRVRDMEIIHVAAELAPVAKVGGLGDVLHGLCRALIDKGNRVTILLPKYDTLDLKGVKDLKVLETTQEVRFAGVVCTNTLWHGTVDSIPVVFIESHDPKEFFDRGKVYGCPDDVDRFNYFCLSALEYIRKKECHVVHLHDWHTAALAGLIKERHPEITAKVVLTLHNLAYQGQCGAADLERMGWKSELLRAGDHYNLLKGGIIFADKITTVSPTYAREILTPEMGCSLQMTLRAHHHKLSGILNGIDYTYWNPKTDPLLPHHYSAHALEHKERVKQELRKRLSLADEKCPLVCAVTRLVPQKGPELIKSALLRTLELGGQFILLGSTGDEKTHTQFYNLKRKLAGSSHVHLELTFNEELSHLVFAGGDLFLIPSLFEPCGLTQQIAMRYGTVPLARSCGGLVDTVFEGKNGFLFGPPTSEALRETLDRALETWEHKPEMWHRLIEAGMSTDFSWEKPAEKYLSLYQSRESQESPLTPLIH
ncbi:glycogen synthase [Chlamydiota bacterium]